MIECVQGMLCMNASPVMTHLVTRSAQAMPRHLIRDHGRRFAAFQRELDDDVAWFDADQPRAVATLDAEVTGHVQ